MRKPSYAALVQRIADLEAIADGDRQTIKNHYDEKVKLYERLTEELARAHTYKERIAQLEEGILHWQRRIVGVCSHINAALNIVTNDIEAGKEIGDMSLRSVRFNDVAVILVAAIREDHNQNGIWRRDWVDTKIMEAESPPGFPENR